MKTLETLEEIDKYLNGSNFINAGIIGVLESPILLHEEKKKIVDTDLRLDIKYTKAEVRKEAKAFVEKHGDREEPFTVPEVMHEMSMEVLNNKYDPEIKSVNNESFYDFIAKINNNTDSKLLRSLAIEVTNHNKDIFIRNLEKDGRDIEIAKMVFDMAKNGATNDRIRRYLGIKAAYWTAMLERKNSIYSRAFDLGKDHFRDSMTKTLIKAAHGYTCTEEKVELDRDGGILKTETKNKHIAPNIKALEMLAYNKASDEYKPTSSLNVVDIGSQVNNIVNVTQLSTDMLKAIVSSNDNITHAEEVLEATDTPDAEPEVIDTTDMEIEYV